MYYNSNKQTNDYYNSYKREIQELEAYEKQKKVEQLVKNIFLGIIFILMILTSYYLYNQYFDFNKIYTTQKIINKKNNKLPPIIISEEELPQSPQLLTYKEKKVTNTTNISKKDIALIVQIIMTQINTKKELSLEEQLTAVETTKFTQKNLKESNHYNKIILNNNQTETKNNKQNNKLVELTNSLNHILEEAVEENTTTPYSTSIKKEIAYRENEMRVIVVKKGDTLSRIAKRAYGNYNDYRKIFSANPEIIKNPNQIYEGMRLRIPS